ncbi:MAG: IPT/TIG domain-containing protein, partial [Myxococcales bacterium]|nr:IPT/TIG domain-containing protein [Myxococcales bacterium]
MNARNPFLVLALAAFPFAADPAGAQPSRPVIERLEPTAGPPGSLVDVIGRGIPPNSQLLLSGVPCEIVRALPNRWTIRIPQNATSGALVVRTPAGDFLGPEFRVTSPRPAPTVLRVEPPAAPPGAEVVLHGTNFSPNVSENQVALGAQPVIVRLATPTTLTVVVPAGAQSGPFTVTVIGAGQTQSPPFTVTAATAITSLEPRIGPPGTRVTIRGTGFSPTVAANRVFMNGVPVRVERASPTELLVSIPRTTTGRLVVDVRGAGRAESAEPFVVAHPPTISRFEPPAGPPGRLVTLHGANFGADVRNVTVTLSGTSLPVRAISPTELTVEIVAGARSGPFQLTVSGFPPVNSAASFQVLTPLVIRELQPTHGPVGSELVIRGEGFSPNARENTVRLSGAEAPILSASPTELRVRVPSAPSGPVEVTVLHNGTTRSPMPFVVTQPPFVAGFEPQQGPVGTEVTIRGTNFGTSVDLVEVKLGAVPMIVRSVSPERIVAVVPQHATSGRIEVSVRLQGSSTSAASFTVLPTLRIGSFEPVRGWPGTEVVVRGEGFAPGATVAFANGPPVRAHAVPAPGELRVRVPDGASSGPLTVQLPDGRSATSATAFEVIAVPAGVGIVAIEASCTRPGCRAVLRGHGFSSRVSANRVRFGTTP